MTVNQDNCENPFPKNEQLQEKGTLYLVATPIGNLGDITLRALETLRSVDAIAAEDTRQTVKLLNHFEIKKPLFSYFEHNKNVKGGYIIKLLEEGKNIALVSDAGSPGISDPGEDIVKLAEQNGINVTMIPGPVAAVAGLVLSGLPTGRFVFEGFLPMNKRTRKERILSLKNETRTIIFYEAPHKLIYTLNDLLDILGDRRISLARELTKKYEEIKRCMLSEALQFYNNEPPRGEFVLVLEGISEQVLEEEEREKWESVSLEQHVKIYTEMGLDKKEAIRKVAEDKGLSKRDVYNELVRNQNI
ncbi:MAG: 16S rRNA (cytidine(1402)-2'-O)-methyltransferase [Bacillota bacterium]|nr:16S rRNA (cytidine(1402)-2'-O)-methyltransferase [Bacillota bacterium]